MTSRLTTGLLVVTLCGCGGSLSDDAALTSESHHRAGKSVMVPDIVGMPQSRASCVLEKAGLRWRYAGERTTFTTAKPSCEQQQKGGTAASPDPRVREQRPRAGRRVRRGKVVVIENECTAHRGSAGGCA